MIRRMQMEQKLKLMRQQEYQQVLQTQSQRELIAYQVHKQKDEFTGFPPSSTQSDDGGFSPQQPQ